MGDIQGRLCTALEDLGALGRTQNSQPAVNLSPTCSTHTEEVILSALSSPPLLFPTCSFGLVSWRKKMTDDILIHISLYAILRGCASESFSCSAMLFDLGYFFEVGESGGSLTREDFLGDQTSWHRHNFLSRRSRSGRAQSTRLPPPSPFKYISFIPHHGAQLTSFDWQLLISLR